MSPRRIALFAFLVAGCAVSVPNDPAEPPEDAPDSRPIHALPTGDCHAMAFSPDNRYLAIARNGPLQIWDIGRETKVVEAAIYGAGNVAWSPDGTRLVTSEHSGLIGDPNLLRLWEFRSGSDLKLLATVKIPWKVRVEVRGPLQVAFAPDGRLLAPGDFAVPGYSREGPEADRIKLIARGAIAVGTAGEQFLSVSPGGVLRRHDSAGKALDEPRDPAHPSAIFVSHVAFAPAANRVALSDSDCLLVRDSLTGRQLFRTVLPESCVDVAYSPDGRVLALSQWREGLWLVNGVTGTVRGWWKGAQNPAFSPDGKFVAWEEHDAVVVRSVTGAIAGAAKPPDDNVPTNESLHVELVSRKAEYVVDPKTTSLADAVTGQLAVQPVDMELVVSNAGVADVLIDPNGHVSGFLHGDGAINGDWEAQTMMHYEEPKWLRLAPGAVHRVAVTKLSQSYVGYCRNYWTLPGKYVVHAKYSTQVRTVAADKEPKWVTLRARPIEVTVVTP